MVAAESLLIVSAQKPQKGSFFCGRTWMIKRNDFHIHSLKCILSNIIIENVKELWKLQLIYTVITIKYKGQNTPQSKTEVYWV